MLVQSVVRWKRPLLAHNYLTFQKCIISSTNQSMGAHGRPTRYTAHASEARTRAEPASARYSTVPEALPKSLLEQHVDAWAAEDLHPAPVASEDPHHSPGSARRSAVQAVSVPLGVVAKKRGDLAACCMEGKLFVRGTQRTLSVSLPCRDDEMGIDFLGDHVAVAYTTAIVFFRITRHFLIRAGSVSSFPAPIRSIEAIRGHHHDYALAVVTADDSEIIVIDGPNVHAHTTYPAIDTRTNESPGAMTTVYHIPLEGLTHAHTVVDVGTRHTHMAFFVVGACEGRDIVEYLRVLPTTGDGIKVMRREMTPTDKMVLKRIKT